MGGIIFSLNAYNTLGNKKETLTSQKIRKEEVAMKKLLAVNDVMEITQFSQPKVYRLFTNDPTFKSFKHFGNWRIEEDNFLDWMEDLVKSYEKK